VGGIHFSINFCSLSCSVWRVYEISDRITAQLLFGLVWIFFFLLILMFELVYVYMN